MSARADRKRILLVEDHLDTVHAMSKLLARNGHVVTTASTLAEARRVCACQQFDLFLCDIGLPDGEGWDLAGLARDCGARAIALTGFGMPNDVTHIEAAGFHAHLIKPVPFDKLESVIAGFCDDEPDLRSQPASSSSLPLR